jgi:hypothetical protein
MCAFNTRYGWVNAKAYSNQNSQKIRDEQVARPLRQHMLIFHWVHARLWKNFTVAESLARAAADVKNK